MLTLIDKYLADLPAERDLVPAQQVRDLLLDIRLTFMVAGDEPHPVPAVMEEPRIFVYRWQPKVIPPGIDGEPQP